MTGYNQFNKRNKIHRITPVSLEKESPTLLQALALYPIFDVTPLLQEIEVFGYLHTCMSRSVNI